MVGVIRPCTVDDSKLCRGRWFAKAAHASWQVKEFGRSPWMHTPLHDCECMFFCFLADAMHLPLMLLRLFVGLHQVLSGISTTTTSTTTTTVVQRKALPTLQGALCTVHATWSGYRSPRERDIWHPCVEVYLSTQQCCINTISSITMLHQPVVCLSVQCCSAAADLNSSTLLWDARHRAGQSR